MKRRISTACSLCSDDRCSSPILKRAKVQALRKFAQGSNNYACSTSKITSRSSDSCAFSPSPMTAKSISIDNDDCELNNFSSVPTVDDFLTFLCFRETAVLPERLDYLNRPKFKTLPTKKKLSKVSNTSFSNKVYKNSKCVDKSNSDFKTKKNMEYKLRLRENKCKTISNKSHALASKHNQLLRSQSVVKTESSENKLSSSLKNKNVSTNKFLPLPVKIKDIKNLRNRPQTRALNRKENEENPENNEPLFRRITRRNSMFEKPAEPVETLKNILAKKSGQPKSSSLSSSKEVAKSYCTPSSSKEIAKSSSTPTSSKEIAKSSFNSSCSKEVAKSSCTPSSSKEVVKSSSNSSCSKEVPKSSFTPSGSKEVTKSSSTLFSTKEVHKSSFTPSSSKEVPTKEFTEPFHSPAVSKEVAKSSSAPSGSKELAKLTPIPAVHKEVAKSSPNPAVSKELVKSSPSPAVSKEVPATSKNLHVELEKRPSTCEVKLFTDRNFKCVDESGINFKTKKNISDYKLRFRDNKCKHIINKTRSLALKYNQRLRSKSVVQAKFFSENRLQNFKNKNNPNSKFVPLPKKIKDVRNLRSGPQTRALDRKENEEKPEINDSVFKRITRRNSNLEKSTVQVICHMGARARIIFERSLTSESCSESAGTSTSIFLTKSARAKSPPKSTVPKEEPGTSSESSPRVRVDKTQTKPSHSYKFDDGVAPLKDDDDDDSDDSDDTNSSTRTTASSSSINKTGCLESKKIIFKRNNSPSSEVTEEISPRKSEAFSADNENSVYAFEPDSPTTTPPFRRLKPMTPIKTIPASNSIAVQVNFENDPKIECTSSSDAQVSSTTDCGDRVFYIPIQTSDTSSTLGVAVKLGTDGPNQKIIMSATLVTNSSTFTANTTSTVTSRSSRCAETNCVQTEPLKLLNSEQISRKSDSTTVSKAHSDKRVSSTNTQTRPSETTNASSTTSSSPPKVTRKAGTKLPQSVTIVKLNRKKKSSVAKTKSRSVPTKSSKKTSPARETSAKSHISRKTSPAKDPPPPPAKSRSSRKISPVAKLHIGKKTSSAEEPLPAAKSRSSRKISSAEEPPPPAKSRSGKKTPPPEEPPPPPPPTKSRSSKKILPTEEPPAKSSSDKKTSPPEEESPASDQHGEILDAPTFYPSEEEFNDPMGYIDTIRSVAEKYGLCRIVPPSNFRPECKVADEMRFTAYNQYVHKMLHRWGPNVLELTAIKKFLATQNITLTLVPLIGGMEVDLPRLYQVVQQCGGLQAVIEKERWYQVADILKVPKLAQDRITKLYDIYCKYLLPYDILSQDERDKLFEDVEADWNAHVEDSNYDNDIFDDIDECILKGRTMPLSCFYRIARNTMMMCFGNIEGQNSPSTEIIEREFWKLISDRNAHICVHSGSIDSGTYGYGFSVAKNSTFRKHPWNLKILTNNVASILRSLGPIIGVTVPTLHVGMLYSACCWYRDPHGLPWVEYLHTGANKIWYGIPDEQNDNFRAAMLFRIPRHIRDTKIWLASDTAMVPPKMLTSQSVTLSKVVQHPGQFIVVFPKAFTSSISTGYHVSESVYFAHASWFNSAKQIFTDMQDSCEPAVFSLEQLLICIATDTRVSYPILKKIVPMLKEFKDTELASRKQLKELGLNAFEKLEINKKRKLKAVFNDEDNYECEICRANLFVSLVINSHEQSNYCLKHAVTLLLKKPSQVKYCKLMYAYTEEELDELIAKVQIRMETKKKRKCHGK